METLHESFWQRRQASTEWQPGRALPVSLRTLEKIPHFKRETAETGMNDTNPRRGLVGPNNMLVSGHQAGTLRVSLSEIML